MKGLNEFLNEYNTEHEWKVLYNNDSSKLEKMLSKIDFEIKKGGSNANDFYLKDDKLVWEYMPRKKSQMEYDLKYNHRGYDFGVDKKDVEVGEVLYKGRSADYKNYTISIPLSKIKEFDKEVIKELKKKIPNKSRFE